MCVAKGDVRGEEHGEGACMVKGMCMERNHTWQGVCMAGGHVWWGGACMVGGMHGRGHAWQGDACRRDGHSNGWYASY